MLFFKIRSTHIAVHHIVSVTRRPEDETVIDLVVQGGEELDLSGEDAVLFLRLLQEHCQVVASPLEKERGTHE